MPILPGPFLDAAALFDGPEPPRLETAGLRLRPWTPDDAPAVRAVYADPDVRRWHARTLVDDDEARALIAGWTGEWSARTGAHWAVEDAQGRLVGRVALSDIDDRDGTAELGYWTAPAARGRGVAVAAVGAVVRWAADGGLWRLEIEHAAGNLASCRVAERSGFELEGVKRASALHEDGFHDMHVHVAFPRRDPRWSRPVPSCGGVVGAGRPAGVVVRAARGRDIDAVWPLVADFAVTATPTRAGFERGFGAAVARPDLRVLVAEEGGVVVGYLLAQLEATFFADGPVAWVQEVMVAEDRRGSGTGRALVRAAEDWARDAGATSVSLASRRAGGFYEALGYAASATFYKRGLGGA
ncbi:GNAT family N-acetyltransferase [Luteimicrobium sp. NPDC057192]|uniref:GNAT family N-acetyltransferase n=1 Tax=Luteimicrobium sp. NPDC057192 TaxID=3346042 RepID=UPI00363D0FC5